MNKRTKTLLHRRRQIFDEWTKGDDFIGTFAVNFSGTVLPYTDDVQERDAQLEAQREKRRRWLQRKFPDEIWRIPVLTSILMQEVGFCYVNGIYYATVAMCQAVVESLLRRLVGGSEKDYKPLVRKLCYKGILSTWERNELLWLASIRNPILHTGKPTKYAKALARVLMPVIAYGKITDRAPIESDCKRALKVVVRLMHSLCLETGCQVEHSGISPSNWS